MAFDGITIAAIRSELDHKLTGGHIGKIIQPEPDELILTIKNNATTYRLLLSASATLPLAGLISTNKSAPMNAPNFCMVLRKHLQGGLLTGVEQPGLERILVFHIQHRNEMGDLKDWNLIIELMGKYSNIILAGEDADSSVLQEDFDLLDVSEAKDTLSPDVLKNQSTENVPAEDAPAKPIKDMSVKEPSAADGSHAGSSGPSLVIVDAIKHISFRVSSVREVLPGRKYFIPETQHKENPLTIPQDTFDARVFGKDMPLFKAVYMNLTGFSPVMGEELCFRAGLDSDGAANTLDESSRTHLWHTFELLREDIQQERFDPNIIYKDEEPFEYAAVTLTQFSNLKRKSFDSISALIEDFYAEKELRTRIRQRSADLRKVVNTALERNARTLSLQEKQMNDTKKRDKYRIYGELLNTYGYSLKPGAKVLEAVNYYNNEPVKIPLNPQLSASENAKKFFDRYNKLKRTAEALEDRIQDTQAVIEHLQSISASLDLAMDEKDLDEIRQELVDYGYIHHKGPSRGRKKQTARPLHFVSSDGFDMYVGKNNYQNEEVTFKIANGNDMWFHANDIPGSHVIVRAMGKEIPDSTYEEAGRLAAYFSSARNAPKVEIDYTRRKNLHKPTGGRPGFVIYHTNYSMIAAPDIRGIRQEKD